MRRKLNTKQLSLLISLLLVLTITVGGTLAYIITKTDMVTNIFKPTEVTCEVVEPGWEDGKLTKSKVTVKNTGDVAAYIRAAIVVTWQNDQGQVLADVPVVGDDYTITLKVGESEAWIESDGYYYHKTPVSAKQNTNTSILVEECTVTGTAPVDGYKLHVEIIADAIQAEPADAVTEAWGVDPSTL